ncbi:hypothetical protein M427DRAFT_154012 [Gonapodya prolifera JEL478]|uniref:Uncharacterized protein n=1 Tax=Gonapodya prolifera (strain JEL478) TaxID=1344416 RepID=A0A139AKA4_GONPJ|nr:hypothetical protein M427DRAFT_154012 [Gonapodya prolifera JEL478]|eukprot:KXS17222.1 hypothetical protein M427DRAFT_154012 [Gonapodya prolifera JEL478]
MDFAPLPKSLLSISHFVAVGMIATAFIPPLWSLAVAGALILPSFVPWAARVAGLLQEPKLKEVRVGRHTTRIEGDFVVFMIGAKWNGPNPINPVFKQIGEAFTGMMEQLKAAPDVWGYLGSESYLGMDTNGPSICNVIYWRSFDHLTTFARSRDSRHFPAWKFLMEHGRKNPAVGFWHESYMVKAGQYENIYANMAPMGLGNCLHTETLPAKGHMSSAKGRAGMTKGEDYVTELGKPDY